jgi:hypothetical protein
MKCLEDRKLPEKALILLTLYCVVAPNSKYRAVHRFIIRYTDGEASAAAIAGMMTGITVDLMTKQGV